MSEQEMTPTPEEEDLADELSDEALDRAETTMCTACSRGRAGS